LARVKTFLAYLGRLFMILLGFLLAIMAATAVFLLAVTGTGLLTPDQGGTMVETLAAALFAIMMFGVFAGMIIAVPVVILAVLAEVFGWRGFLLHGVLGAILGTGAALIGALNDGAPAVIAGAAAGITGAWVYWLVVGRKAGLLFDRILAERRAAG
jgi:membrane protease YdiL (CAAX protease family)